MSVRPATGDQSGRGDLRLSKFVVPLQEVSLRAIVGTALGWEHVSVRVIGERRCPSWVEMKNVNRLFFYPHDTCVQLHPRVDRYISRPGGEFILQIWRKQDVDHELPPPEFI